MSIINELNIKIYVYKYIWMSVERENDHYLTLEIYKYLEEKYWLIENEEKWDKLNELWQQLLKDLLKVSDEEFLEFVKQSLEYIYKREYWQDNLYESFDKEPEDNYYWIMWNFFSWYTQPKERKYHQELYDFYKEKSKETLDYLWRKNKQSLKNEPEDNIWCIENIERVEKYRKKLLAWEFNKEGVIL